MWKSWAAAAVLSLSGSLALAGQCPSHYVDGRLPEIKNPKLAVATRELCYQSFGVLHSGVTRTPLWSAEWLKAEALNPQEKIKRENAFHAEPRLPPNERAELDDYARSGFDRGHLAPNGNMGDRESRRETFSLANIVPQNGENNRGLWNAIEQSVRKLAKQEGQLYVISGPVYQGARVQTVGKVLVPTHLYKALYSPRQKAGGAWWVENVATDKYEVLSLAQLEERIGINLMPSLTPEQKRQLMRMPNVKVKAKK